MTLRSMELEPTAEPPQATAQAISFETILSKVFLSSAARKVRTAGQRWSGAIEVVCLALIVLICLSVRLFPAIRGESTIYDFDPYFNHRTTKYLAREGFAEFWNWYDDSSWYPLGRPVGQTLFPGLMTTSYVVCQVLRSFGVMVNVTEVSTYLPPAFSCLTALVTHCFAKHASGSRVAGLFASLFVGISPAYVKTSLVGSYDNECVAIFAMISGFYLWTRSIQKGSMLSALLAAVPSAYMVTAWGGYVFLINAIAAHMVALCVLGQMTPRHQVAYVVFYLTITALCVNVPFLNFSSIKTSEHMASHAVFLLVSAVAMAHFVSSLLPTNLIKSLQALVVRATGIFLILVVACLTLTGKTSWSSRSLTLLDPTYATKYVPIIASVSEHQPTTWVSYVLDLHMTIFLAPMGLFICLRRGGGLFFVGLYGVLACYFSAVMVRLMLVLSPAASILAGVGASALVTSILSQAGRTSSEGLSLSKDLRAGNSKPSRYTLPFSLTVPVLLVFFWMCVMKYFPWFVPFPVLWFLIASPNAAKTAVNIHRAPENIIGQFHLIFSEAIWIKGGPIGPTDTPKPDDFREAYHWFRQNTHPKAKLMAWWDYGYQVSEVGNRTVLVDNNTWNSTHIATVGLAFASEESAAYAIAQDLDVDYVFVVFGGMARFASDDLNKLLWMVRIASGIYPRIQQSDFLGARGQFTVGNDAPAALRKSLMYKLSYHRFGQATKGFDFARKVQVGSTDIQLRHFEEVFTTENWVVRIYKVRNTDNRDKRMHNAIDSAFL